MSETRSVRRLGITMRSADAVGYAEKRDALARDWAAFMACALPGVAWLPVPNLGAEAAAFADAWDLDGLILSGGDDIGDDAVRDATERALFDHAVAGGRPILGVCRGLQLIQDHFGGVLEPCPGNTHVAVRHAVAWLSDGAERQVNSYHRRGIRVGELAPGLRPLAVTADGWVEAAAAEVFAVLGVMWHPERETPPAESDIALLRNHFLTGTTL